MQITTTGAARTSVVVLAILLAAIACFSVAATPAARLPWRGGKTLVVYHRAAVTATGVVLLLGAVAYALTR